MSDFNNNANVARPARVTANRDIVTVPTLWKWAAQGKVFEAGMGMEDTAVSTLAAIADITASCSLQAPTASTTLVIPILLAVSLTVDGNALTELSVSFTKPSGLTGTALTLSGTALTSKHCVYQTNPAKTAQTATALSAVTVSVLVAADYVEYQRKIAIDAVLTTGLVAMGGPSNVATINFLQEGAPHIMTSGAAMLVTVKNGTTDGKFKPYIQWAEVTIDDLL